MPAYPFNDGPPPEDFRAQSARPRVIAGYVPVSAELLNPTSPSPAEVAQWRAERETRESREDARQAQLLAAGGVIEAVAKLHAPDENRDCRGCDGSDYGPSPWPCPTWDVLDKHAPR